jgi:hypothetical protein
MTRLPTQCHQFEPVVPIDEVSGVKDRVPKQILLRRLKLNRILRKVGIYSVRDKLVVRDLTQSAYKLINA